MINQESQIDLLVGYHARGFLPKPAPTVRREQELFFDHPANPGQGEAL